jgi:hypothetical protein
MQSTAARVQARAEQSTPPTAPTNPPAAPTNPPA